MVKWLRFFCFLFVLIFSFENLIAGNTGKIAGKVTDQETSEALVGVTILVEGTTAGAATDINGYYIINNITPGTYTLVISAVGYQKKRITNVSVSVDFTTKQNITLRSEAINVEGVTIEAQAPLVRQDLTSSHTVVDASTIEALPVEGISQILSTQAGITKDNDGALHIRGGRTNEISYTINGVSIANAFDNSQMVSIATNAIQELSVVSGTFNAEYGNALSGIVNTVTKEGSDQYKGMASFYTGDYLSTRKETFYNIDAIDPLNNTVGELTLGGPIPFSGDAVRFFVSGRFENTKGYLYGIREHNPSDFCDFTNANRWRVQMTGDGSTVPMNKSTNMSATGKLTFRPTAMIKLNYDVLLSKYKGQSYIHAYKYNPDMNPWYYSDGQFHSLELTHTISNNTFYTLKGSYGTETTKSFLNENPWDSSVYMPSQWLTRPTTSTFYFGGSDNDYSKKTAKTYTGKFDITSQLSNQHEIKGGFEYKYHNLDYDYFSILRDTSQKQYLLPTVPDPSNPSRSKYTRNPKQFAAYVQDKMEYESIVINFGIRYDFFDSDFEYATNIMDPSGPRAKASSKQQVSPRLGVSFPITDKGIIHFSYGHFFQMPPFQYLYVNPKFYNSLWSGTPVYGNADLKPEKNISYELGLQQQMTEDLAFNVTGFYKDVRNLLALETTRISGEKVYQRYVNKDYGNIKGITFSLTKRRTKTSNFGFTLDYTFQTAEGNDVNSDAFFMDLLSGRQSEKQIIYLGWDQTHTLSSTISYGVRDNWNASLIGRLGTGMPYTPYITDNMLGLKTNSERKPAQMSADLLLEKSISLMNLNLMVFMKVFNLFDNLIERYVYEDTGTATYTLSELRGEGMTMDTYINNHPDQKGLHKAAEYFNRPNYYAAPREVRIGFSVLF
jgi:outer membrane receptor protein involved in Fe transport